MWYIYSINIHKYFLYSSSRAERSALGMRINDTNLIVAIDKKEHTSLGCYKKFVKRNLRIQ